MIQGQQENPFPTIDPPMTLGPFTFTNRYGLTFTVSFTRSAYRGFTASPPGAGGQVLHPMWAVTYYADERVLRYSLDVVYAAQSKGIGPALGAIAKAYAMGLLKDEQGEEMQKIREEEEEEEPSEVSGIVWPYNFNAVICILAADYLGYRFRGAAGAVRQILPNDYGTVDFWVEPVGIPALGGAPPPPMN
jgi:hypothetical protein